MQKRGGGKKEDRSGFPIVRKFMIAYAAFAVTIGLVFAFVYYRQFSQASFELLREQAISFAGSVSHNFDFSGHEELLDEGDLEHPDYQRLFASLNRLTEISGLITYVYTLRPVMGGDIAKDWEFVVDAAESEDEDGDGIISPDEEQAAIGEYYDISDWDNILEGTQRPTANTTFYIDRWGTWLTGYAPIYDNGVWTGIVAVDFAFDDVKRVQNIFLHNVIVTFVITLILSLIFGIAGVLIFLNEKRKLHTSLEARNKELQRLVENRTKTLREFMVVVVDDLQAPLDEMKAGLHRTESQIRKKDVKEEMRVMVDVVSGMQGIVKTILDASQLSMGKIMLKKKTTDLHKLINLVVKEFVATATSEEVNLEAEVSKMPSISVDNARIMQVFQNLISNAIKFTSKGGSVWVRAGVDESAKHILIVVQDTGKGISKADIDKLFVPFVRVGDQKEPGTGLGLSIVRGIVEAHGGTVRVESEVGKGSTFTVELPVHSKSIQPSRVSDSDV